MFVADAIAVCRLIYTLGLFIKKTYRFCDEHESALSVLVELGIDYKSGHDIYIANKSATVNMCERVEMCGVNLQTLNNRPLSPSLQQQVDSLVAALKECQRLVQKNVMPADLSWLQKQWWIAKRIKQAQIIQQQFDTQHNILTNTIQSIALALTINISAAVQNNNNNNNNSKINIHSPNSALDYAELKALIIRHQHQMDDTAAQLLQALEPRSAELDAVAMKVSLMSDRIDARLLDVQKQIEQCQSPTHSVDDVIQTIEQRLGPINQWNAAFRTLHADMAAFEAQLAQHTQVIRNDIHVVDRKVETILHMLQSLMTQAMSNDNRAVLQAMSAVPLGQHESVAASSWKYKFKRFEAADVIVNFADDSSLLGAGATGGVYKGEVRVANNRSKIIAFKRFNIPDTLKVALRQVDAMKSTELMDTPASASSPATAADNSDRDSHTRTIRRVIREARIAWSLNGHNNCVALYGVCLHPDKCGLIMEYCSDKTLQHKLYCTEFGFEAVHTDIRLKRDEQIACATQIIDALHYLHAKGVIHRDLKSCNILVHNYASKESPLYSFKLNDFGSARVTKDFLSSFSNQTAAPAAFTPRWLPPEALSMDDDDNDDVVLSAPAVDVYGLGCVLGEIFLMKPPYANSKDRDVIIAQHNVKKQPFAWNELESISVPLCDLIKRCCSRDPHDRPTLAEIHQQKWPFVLASMTPRHATPPLPSAKSEVSVPNFRPAPRDPALLILHLFQNTDNRSMFLTTLQALKQVPVDQQSELWHKNSDGAIKALFAVFQRQQHDNAITDAVCELIHHIAVELPVITALGMFKEILCRMPRHRQALLCIYQHGVTIAQLQSCADELLTWQTLNFYHSRIGDAASAQLAELIRCGYCTSLTSLNLRSNSMAETGCRAVTEALSRGCCPSLTLLDLSYNPFHDAGCIALSMALQTRCCPKLKRLELFSNGFGDAGLTALADAFKRGGCPSLSYLEISGNKCTAIGCRALADAFRSGNCRSLTILYFSRNTISDSGCQSLSSALQAGYCPQLSQLIIWDNQIADFGCRALIDALRSGNCSQLKKLSFSDNKYNDALKSFIYQSAPPNCEVIL